MKATSNNDLLDNGSLDGELDISFKHGNNPNIPRKDGHLKFRRMTHEQRLEEQHKIIKQINIINKNWKETTNEN